MTLKRILALFAITCIFYTGSLGQEEIKIECNDVNLQGIVDSALQLHNKNLTEGNQLALYQILQASKAQNETGEFLSVRFSGRETDCLVGGEKVWNQCDYLPDPLKALSICHADALLKETNEIISVKCSVEPPIISEPRPSCLGCPVDIDVTSEDLKESLSYSVSKANHIHNHAHLFILSHIGSATRQVIAGFRYRLQFDMQKSNCTKADFKELTEQCHADQEDEHYINCNSTVDVAPWRLEVPETHVKCGSGRLYTGFSRKRPPGWSPLRNIHNFMAQPKPKPKPKKEESSEESLEGKAPKSPERPKKPGPPRADPTPEAKTPAVSSCPGKPWKEFKPVRPPPPPPSNKTEISLSDTDLLG